MLTAILTGYLLQASDAAKQAGNKVQGEAKGAGGGSGPTLGGIADKAKQAVGSATSVSVCLARGHCVQLDCKSQSRQTVVVQSASAC